MQDAVATGNATKINRLEGYDGRRYGTVEELDREPIHVESPGWMSTVHLTMESWRWVEATCGLRGVRPGEASHPGTASFRHRRARGIVRPVKISSDDELLVPGASRNVFPRVSGADSVADVTQVHQEFGGTMPTTVLATPETLVKVGRGGAI